MSVTTTTNSLIPQSMDQAVRLAEMMSKGKLVPDHLRTSPGDCLMVIEQAMRWNMSPFAVAQCTSVIQGKLMFEGKLVAAAVQSSGILDSRLDYHYEGEGDQRQITVSGVMRGETTPRSVVVKLKDAKTNNRMWTVQPDQQLAYHGARVWSRRYAPEVMLGVYAPEEVDAPRLADDFKGPTIDAEPAPRQSPATERTLQQRASDAAERILEAAPTIEALTKLETRIQPLLADLEVPEPDLKAQLVQMLAERRAAIDAAGEMV